MIKGFQGSGFFRVMPHLIKANPWRFAQSWLPPEIAPLTLKAWSGIPRVACLELHIWNCMALWHIDALLFKTA